jgi:predicted negative regulator of RcsB-dependent stress response
VAIYDTEEEQLEQLKKWWESNNTSLIAGVAAAVVIVTGFNFWQAQQLEKRGQASELYQQILDASAANNSDSIEKLSGQLASEYSSSIYSNYAALQLAKLKVQKGDVEAAKAILQKEIKTNESDELQHLSRLRLIQLLLETKQYEQGLQLIAEVDPASSEGFSASYDELQGDLYVAMERYDEARNAYQSAIRSGFGTPLVQFKLDDIAVPALATGATK